MKYEVHHYHHFPVMDRLIMLSPMALMLLAADEVQERKRKRREQETEDED
jgi:hypothetical protein